MTGSTMRVIRKGHTSNHSISVTGGSEKFRSSLSLGYLKQEGIEYAQDYTRYSIGASTEFKPVKFLTFGATLIIFIAYKHQHKFIWQRHRYDPDDRAL